jgi:hypothetical protein
LLRTVDHDDRSIPCREITQRPLNKAESLRKAGQALRDKSAKKENHPYFPSFPALSYESRGRHLEMGIFKLYVCFEQLVMTILYRFPGLFTGLEEGAAGAVILSFIPRLFMSVLL